LATSHDCSNADSRPKSNMGLVPLPPNNMRIGCKQVYAIKVGQNDMIDCIDALFGLKLR